MRRNVTLYLDLDLFQAYRKKISPTPISQDFEAHMRKNMGVPDKDQASSTASVDTSTGKEPSYDELLHKYESIVEAAGKRRKYLITEKVYDDLCKLAESMGLSAYNLEKLDEVIPKMQAEWTKSPTYMIFFIAYLRARKTQLALEMKLNADGRQAQLASEKTITYQPKEEHRYYVPGRPWAYFTSPEALKKWEEMEAHNERIRKYGRAKTEEMERDGSTQAEAEESLTDQS